MPKFKDLAAEYASLWEKATVNPQHLAKVQAVANQMKGFKTKYDAVSARTKVPWYVIGAIHNLEGSFKFGTHLHNGDPLTQRTVHVPAGRPQTGNPPFDWVDSAIDALSMKGMHEVGDWSVERIAFELEGYNGWGYRQFHPDVLTPYLWSCTSVYSKGKYASDGNFDRNLISAQVGVMAVMKVLAQNEAIQRQSGIKPKEPPAPVFVESGFHEVATNPFGLREEPRDDAKRLMVVDTEAVRKLNEVDATWWKVEVSVADGSKMTGFAKAVWLKKKMVQSNFDEESFAEACLNEARVHGVSAHFLLALAYAEHDGFVNAGGDAGRFGPFAMNEEDWAAYNDPAKTGFGADGRINANAQAAAAAAMVVKLTEEARGVLPDKKLPTSEELMLARIFGAKSLTALLADPQSDRVRDRLSPTVLTPEVLEQIFGGRTKLLNRDMTIEALRLLLRERLDEGLEDATDLILKVEPDLVVGPAATASDGDAPWMGKAKTELGNRVKEIPGAASNPEVEKYFVETTLGRQTDDVAWCAAFVSWCVKTSGGSKKPIVYSARAADWLNNGESVSGPQYGAVAVTKPLAQGASGHVGFVTSWDGTNVKLLGGNQGDSVSEKNFHIADVRGWRMM